MDNKDCVNVQHVDNGDRCSLAAVFKGGYTVCNYVVFKIPEL